nr:spermatogenesis-associated protein 24 isoform X2 [Anolis sagrei ordinatus]
MALVAFQQLRDLVEAQQALLDELRRQKEEEEHTVTKTNLAKVSEQLEFALGEIDVLSKHLEREKQAFDSALSRVNHRVLKQSVQKEKLISKCSEIETHIQRQEDILNFKENEIKELQHFINKQKQTLKKQASEFKIEKQQENYISEVLGKKNKKGFK